MDLKAEALVVRDLKTRLTHLEQTVDAEQKHLAAAKVQTHRVQHAQEILQHLAQAVQQKAHQQIAKVVSSCLQTVFGDNAYGFEIKFDRKRGRTEARLLFVRDGQEIDPLTASGGGMVDVAAFALRVACLVLHRPRLSRVVVLDEPFRFVSAQYQDNVRLMLEGLSRDMGLQIIFITHCENLATGKIINIE